MMETLQEEETINYAKVSDIVSKLLETMAAQFHAQLNSYNLASSYKVTILDSYEIPDILIKDYLYRITSMSRCLYRDIIVALVYADQLITNEIISGISFHNVHRLMAITLMVSTKFYDDVHYSNKAWASILGLKLQELNEMEILFLEALNFELNVNLDAMKRWADAIALFADENPEQERQPHSPTQPTENNFELIQNSVEDESHQHYENI